MTDTGIPYNHVQFAREEIIVAKHIMYVHECLTLYIHRNDNYVTRED